MSQLISISTFDVKNPSHGVKRYAGRVVLGDSVGAEVTVDIGSAARFKPLTAVRAGVAGFGAERLAAPSGVDVKDLLALVSVGEVSDRQRAHFEEIVRRVLATPEVIAVLSGAVAAPGAAAAGPAVIAAQTINQAAKEGYSLELSKLKVIAEDVAAAANDVLVNAGSAERIAANDILRAARAWWAVRDTRPEARAMVAQMKATQFRPGSAEHRDAIDLWIAEASRAAGALPSPQRPIQFYAPAIDLPGTQVAGHTGCACKARPMQ